ncbi:MAG: hypothetical protein C4522_07920 [Desulfobacteraceae bacterium]|nr:MAG: hypothetical protein C4522_07920 [Desulfobacteraceae bacterium]
MKKRNEKQIVRTVIATGVSSVVTQLFVIREFLVQYTGNEFVIALILFNWLVIGGFGTLPAGFITSRYQKATPLCLGILSLFLAGLSTITILGIRFLRDFFFIHGASVGFYPTFWYIFLLIMPYGLLLGFVLPYSLYVIRHEHPEYPPSRIYIADNLGDVSGGALFSFLLVYLLSPVQAICLAGLPLVVITSPFFRERRRDRVWYSIIAGGVLAIFAAGIFLETRSLQPKVGKLIDYRESKYGRIEVHQNEELITLFSDGVPVFSNQNSALAEEVIHYPLSQLKNPQHILLISAVGGMIDELEKHDLASIDYVELDPEVSSILFRFDLLKTIRGLSVINEDGRAYLMRTDKQYDAIIVNLPEPDTFQINRFYTSRFFELVKARLTPHGVFSFTMDGYDNYLAEPQRRKLSSLFNTVSDYFQNVLLLPGQRIFFLCTDSPVHRDIPSLLASKGIATTYISRYFYGNVTDFRIEQLNQQIDLQTEKNDDNAPRLMRLMFTQWFTKFSTSPIWFFGAVAFVLVIYMMRLHVEEYVLFSTGCMTMGCELMIVFAFQIYFGYIYYQIGLIITVFLAGLLPGAWLGEHLRPHARRVLVWTDILLISLMLVFIAIYFRMGDKLPVLFYLGTGFLFSVLCGCQFPVALEPQGNAKRSAAGAFSADLIGAALGALITSVLLIPYYGIMGAAVGLILLKMTSLIMVGKRHA